MDCDKQQIWALLLKAKTVCVPLTIANWCSTYLMLRLESSSFRSKSSICLCWALFKTCSWASCSLSAVSKTKQKNDNQHFEHIKARLVILFEAFIVIFVENLLTAWWQCSEKNQGSRAVKCPTNHSCLCEGGASFQWALRGGAAFRRSSEEMLRFKSCLLFRITNPSFKQCVDV